MHALELKIQHAVEQHQAGSLQGACLTYGEILGEHPDLDPVLHLYAIALHQQGKMQDSLVALNKATTLNPEIAEYYMDKGRVLADMGDLVATRTAYVRALDLAPDAHDTRYRLAVVLSRLGDHSDAVQHYIHLLDNGIQSANVYAGLADSLTILEESEGAILAYENALKLEPQNIEVMSKLAKIHEQNGAYAAALACAENRLEFSSDEALVNDTVRLNILAGNQYYNGQNLPAAKKCYQRALALQPAHQDAAMNLSLVEYIENLHSDTPLFLALPSGGNYGWGICGNNLKKELPDKANIFAIQYEDWQQNGHKNVPGVLLSAIGAESLDQVYPLRGERNVGYTFFERDLTDQGVENAKKLDLVLTGSTWAVECLREKGIQNSDLLIQGVEPSLFYPIDTAREGPGFFIFSGGKFELRKGQDIVLKAIAVLQQKYPDIILINAWYNMWPNSMETMKLSPHIQYRFQGEEWQSIMQHLYQINGLDESRIITLDLVPHEKQRELFCKTDLGLFPNRSEGGTNLVLMEYMACAKPVIATNCTGHTDIVSGENALLLNRFTHKEYRDENGEHFANWLEPDLDEVIESIEYAYHNRDSIQSLGKQAGEDLKQYTWDKTATSLLHTLKKWNIL